MKKLDQRKKLHSKAFSKVESSTQKLSSCAKKAFKKICEVIGITNDFLESNALVKAKMHLSKQTCASSIS